MKKIAFTLVAIFGLTFVSMAANSQDGPDHRRKPMSCKVEKNKRLIVRSSAQRKAVPSNRELHVK